MLKESEMELKKLLIAKEGEMEVLKQHMEGVLANRKLLED